MEKEIGGPIGVVKFTRGIGNAKFHSFSEEQSQGLLTSLQKLGESRPNPEFPGSSWWSPLRVVYIWG